MLTSLVITALPIAVGLSTATPAVASVQSSAATARPGLWPTDDRDNPDCRHFHDTIYIPRDTQGYAFNFYCRDGYHHGIYRHDDGPKVCGKDKGVFKDVTPLKDWANKHTSATGTVDFGQLCEEPCNTMTKSAKDDTHFDLTFAQCAQIRHLSIGESPCQQWKKLVDSLVGQDNGEKADGVKVQPWQDTDVENVSFCDSDNPIFQKAYRVPVWDDPKTYDRYDFTAPDSVSQYINPIVGIATWLGISAGVIGVLICAGRMALAHRTGGEEPLTGMFWVMGACVMIGSASGIVGMVLW